MYIISWGVPNYRIDLSR